MSGPDFDALACTTAKVGAGGEKQDAGSLHFEMSH